MRTIIEANTALLVLASISVRDESEMNRRMAIPDARRKPVKRQCRPIGVRIERFHQPVFLCPRDDLQTPRSPGDGFQNPITKSGLDGEQFCVRLFETEFEEVA